MLQILFRQRSQAKYFFCNLATIFSASNAIRLTSHDPRPRPPQALTMTASRKLEHGINPIPKAALEHNRNTRFAQPPQIEVFHVWLIDHQRRSRCNAERYLGGSTRCS